jgi:hypothetical protein
MTTTLLVDDDSAFSLIVLQVGTKKRTLRLTHSSTFWLVVLFSRAMIFMKQRQRKRAIRNNFAVAEFL